MRLRPRLLTVTAFAAALLLTVRLGEFWPASEIAVGGRLAAQSVEKETSSAPPAGTGAAAATVSDDPFEDDMLSEAEIETLQDLAARRRELERREREIETRDALLAAAEKRVDEKIAELRRLKGEMEALIDSHDEQEKAKIQSLVKVYENMKPKDAARIFGELDMDVLLAVVGRMKERKIAPILAEMNPDRAKLITTELAQRREIAQTAEAKAE